MSTIASVDLELFRRVVDHMVAAADAAPSMDDPFPHTLIRGLFPDDVYDRLQSLLPDPSQYKRFSYQKHQDADGESNRRRFQLKTEFMSVLDPERQMFWRTIRNAIGSGEFKQSVFARVRDGLALRYRCDPDAAASLPGHALPELFHETAGYHIKPHPDTRRKVVTMQIALPTDESCAAMGTEFYRRSLRPADWADEPRGFEIAKTMPFVPNTAYAFAVLNTIRLKSWHGRSQMSVNAGGDGATVRNSILNIWYERIEDANPEIAADNAEVEQSARLRRAA